MRGTLLATLAVALPVLAFVLWPLVRRGAGRGRFLTLPPDPREQWLEAKRVALAALRELEFEHAAGHVSDADYGELAARYEAEAGAAMAELDRLGEAAARVEPATPRSPGPLRSAWRHPLALTAGAIALVVFGVALGVGIVRYTEPDRTAGAAPAGAMPGMSGSSAMPGAGPGAMPPATGGGGPVTPEILQGMLRAARESLLAGRYSEAIAAYQAVLKREPKNVDALTHLGLIVAIGGHADSALETFDRALQVDPNYPPALLYRGQVLYEAKNDVPGAIKSWERFLAVAPAGGDRERVRQMIAEARARGSAPK